MPAARGVGAGGGGGQGGDGGRLSEPGAPRPVPGTEVWGAPSGGSSEAGLPACLRRGCSELPSPTRPSPPGPAIGGLLFGGGGALNFAPLSPVKRTWTRGVSLPDLGESEDDGIQFPSADFLVFSQGSSLLKGQAGCLTGAGLLYFLVGTQTSLRVPSARLPLPLPRTLGTPGPRTQAATPARLRHT